MTNTNATLNAFEEEFGWRLNSQDVAGLRETFSNAYSVKSLESRYESGMGHRREEFSASTSALREIYPKEESDLADRLIYFVLEARKTLTTPSQRGLKKSGSQLNIQPKGTIFTPEHSSTASYAHSTISDRFSNDTRSPFDRNGAGRLGSSIYYRQETPPVVRRIPRPKEQITSPAISPFIGRGVAPIIERTNFVDSPNQAFMKENLLFPDSNDAFNSPYPTKSRPFATPNSMISRIQPPVVPMRTLITEVLHAMKGLSGTYIRSDGDELKLSSAASLSLEMKSCTRDLILLGNLCRQLPQQPADDRASDLFKKAFHHGMFLERNNYVHAVDRLTTQVADISDEQAFFFMDTFLFTWMPKLRILVNLWKKWKDHHTAGYELVDSLLEIHSISTNDSPRKTCTEALLREVIPVYIDLLKLWILNGKLHEYSGRWLIKAYKSASEELDVMGTYRLDRVPPRYRFFIDPRLPQKILEVGRLIGCLGGPEWDGWDDVRAKVSTITIEDFIDYNANHLVMVIQEVYTQAGNDVKNTLVKRDQLFEHLEIISNVFFLQKEQFSYQLFKEIRSISNQFFKTISASEAASVIARAAAANGIISLNKRARAHQSHFEVIAEIGNTPRDSIRRNYISNFNIKYKAATGLAACILSRDALLRYQGIFQAMWSIQFVSQGVTEAQRDHLQLTRDIKTNRVKTLYPLINTWSQVLAHVHSVVYSLAYYSSDVCEYARNRLRARMESVIDLTECITQHDKHLKSIEERLFLDTKLGLPVRNCLGPLIDDAIALFQHYTRFTAELRGQFEKCADTTKNDDSFVRMEHQLDIEDDMLRFQRVQLRETAHLHAKFKDAQAKLFESLLPYGDLAPMSNLREFLM